MDGTAQYKRIPGGADDATERPPVNGDEFLARLHAGVAERFERITGFTAVVIPVHLPGISGASDEAIVPVHPICAKCEGHDRGPGAWKEHLAELCRCPKGHVHRCNADEWCAVVPVLHAGSCLAACKLVCYGTMAEHIFARNAEILTVLVERFCAVHAAMMGQFSVVPDYVPAVGQGARPAFAPVRYPQVRRALEYIERHASDAEMNVTSVARWIGCNANYLAHLFTQDTGMRMSRYIASRRVELAKVFLKTTTWDITRVARESGFASRGWFSQVFRTHTGCTPGQYRGTESNPGHAAAG
ncbi:MAG: helix-turn-helix transcriptional regulator [bacterium]|nr:helix-turn-helix transcriptional regulator [bacterium]